MDWHRGHRGRIGVERARECRLRTGVRVRQHEPMFALGTLELLTRGHMVGNVQRGRALFALDFPRHGFFRIEDQGGTTQRSSERDLACTRDPLSPPFCVDVRSSQSAEAADTQPTVMPSRLA